VEPRFLTPAGSVTNFGTGFFIRDDGLIATASHVYLKALNAIVDARAGVVIARRFSRTTRGQWVGAPIELVAQDYQHDVVLLKMKAVDPPWKQVGGVIPLPLDESGTLEDGAQVCMRGYFGTDDFPLFLRGTTAGTTGLGPSFVQELLIVLPVVTREIADAAMLRRVDEREGRDVVGQKGKRDCAGILIPYYRPGIPQAFNYRLRRDKPEWTEGKNGELKPDGKYLSPPNGGNRLFIPPGVSAEQLADPQIPIALVEGEKKALALGRLAHYETETPRFVPIALAGVWNWRGRIGKTSGPKGERIDVKGPIADLGLGARQELTTSARLN